MELIRSEEQSLLKALHIYGLGSKEAVLNGVRLLQKTKQKAIGVRDGDAGESPADKLFKLPGTQAPEKEVFSCAGARNALHQQYGIDVATLINVSSLNDHTIGLPL